MVDSIKGQADLLSVLRKYGVRYYIISYPLREFRESKGHWIFSEPHEQQVQPYVPRMHGAFYAPEVFRYPIPVGSVITHQDSATVWVTRIFDISSALEDTTPEGK